MNPPIHETMMPGKENHNTVGGPSEVGNSSLVSVIINFLNEGSFIEEAIESVFGQTYDNWELLLIDDGSTDIGTEIAKKYEKRFPARVRYLEHNEHQNKGTSASRNLGIAHACGEFIAFLDGDDVWLPDKLERQVATLKYHPEAAMVYGPAQIWRSWPGNTANKRSNTLQELGVPRDTLFMPLGLIPFYLKNDGITPCTCAILVRSKTVRRVGGFDEAFPGMYDDQVFYIKLCLEAPVFVSGECTSKYRRHSDSMCSVAFKEGEYHRARLQFLDWIEAFLMRKRIRNIEVWLTLKRELIPYRYQRIYRLILFANNVTRKGKGLFKAMVTGPIKENITQRVKVLRNRIRFATQLKPLSEKWGFDRGFPIHRYYLEQFLREVSVDIRGHCLEFQEDSYTSRFGGAAVTKLDILNIDNSRPLATIIADLTAPNDIPSNYFDCIICTHVLHIIYEFDKAITELHRILKPGGILLVAVPHISMCSPQIHEFWRFTPDGLRSILAEEFHGGNIVVKAFGNSLTAAGELRGLVVHEFTKGELDCHDPRFPVEVCARAQKSE